MSKNAWGSSDPVEETKGGTNQSTYTTGDILYSDASNSLEKLGIGSTDQVLAVSSGIPSWQTLPLSGTANLELQTTTLTNSQIKNLVATPITVVTAGSAGEAKIFVRGVLKLNAGSEALTTDNEKIELYWVNGSGGKVASSTSTTGWMDQTTDQIALLGASSATDAAADAEGAAIVIKKQSGTEFGGNASNDATMEVAVYYTTISL